MTCVRPQPSLEILRKLFVFASFLFQLWTVDF